MTVSESPKMIYSTLTSKGAFHIIRMSIDTTCGGQGIRPTMLASRDLPSEMICEQSDQSSQVPPVDGSTEAIGVAISEFSDTDDRTLYGTTPQPRQEDLNVITLVHRLRAPSGNNDANFETDLSSDEDGFSIVHRPRPAASAISNHNMSSPELIPSVPIDILAATGSSYPSDDEWTVV